MDEPRFYVVSVTGLAITTSSRGGRMDTSYSVLDAARCHREVYSRNGGKGGRGHTAAARLADCEREAARRNALDAAGCAA